MGLLRLTPLLRKRFASQHDVQRLLYGKRTNAVHSTSKGRPSAALLLTKVPDAELAPAVERALAVQELSKDDVLSVLRSNRALRRLDRSVALVDALTAARFPLTSHHYSLLMAHANDEKNVDKALSFWQAAVEQGLVSQPLHGALLATYRNTGKWEDAIRHCTALWEDKHTLDAHALHTVLNACRRYGPWESALQVFDKAIAHGTKPNAVVYLELLRVIEHARAMPSRWKYALAILDALHGNIDVTAGHYNAALSTLGGVHMWRKGVELFERMKANSVQPSRDTLNQLLLLNPGNVAHCIQCVAEAHALGMPVTDTMYRAVLSNLFRLELDHEASQFAEREYRRDIEDPGNTTTTTLALSFAMIDSLLAHSRPRDALVFYSAFEPKLGDAVGPATRMLGSLGEPAQRWLVQGRVAVVDHNIILSPRMESLLHHYDSIFIPFSSVRLLVRRARQLGDTVQGRFTRYAFARLRRLLKEGEWARAGRVLPLSHQLQAHQYLTDGPTSPEALQLLREEARIEEGDGRSPSLAQRLLASVSEERELGSELGATTDGAKPLVIRAAAPVTDMRIAKKLKGQAGSTTPSSPTATAETKSFKLKESGRVSSTERVLAVAVMLKSLNPDADIHVLSTNKAQLDVVARWDACKPGTHITAVKYPEELFVKAPPANADTPSLESGTELLGDKGATTTHNRGARGAKRVSFLMPS